MHTHIRTHIRTYIVTGLISAVSAHLSQQVVHGVVCYNLEPAIQVVLLRDIAVNTLYDICDLQHTKFTIHILNTLNSIGRFSIVWPDIVAGISFGKFVIYTQTAKIMLHCFYIFCMYSDILYNSRIGQTITCRMGQQWQLLLTRDKKIMDIGSRWLTKSSFRLKYSSLSLRTCRTQHHSMQCCRMSVLHDGKTTYVH